MRCAACEAEMAGNGEFCSRCGARSQTGRTPKRLTLSAADKKLAGVCGGLAEYFAVDPTLLRVAWAVITLVTGVVFGAVAYLVAWALMPAAPLRPPSMSAPQGQTAGPRTA